MNKAKELVNKMTTEEKLSLLNGSGSMSVGDNLEKYGLREFKMADGPHGIRVEEDKSASCVCIPCSAALGATWNREIVERIGEVLASDCLEHNIDLLLGPGMNIKRTDLCGRNFEYFSEDPVLTGEMAVAYVDGIQKHGVGACVKHLAVNNQETDRLYVNMEIDERTMREIYFKAFEMVVKKSNPMAIMSATNKINGVLCSENPLVYGIPKEEWGYEGAMMTDWGCCKDAQKGISSGLDLMMPKSPMLQEQLNEAVQSGRILEERINDAAYRIVNMMLKPKRGKAFMSRQERHKLCRKAEEEAIVLLKNDNNLLPITKEKYKSIAVVGEFAVNPVITGYGSSRVFVPDELIEKPFDEIKKLAGEDIKVDYIPLYSSDKYPEQTQFNYLTQISDIDKYDLVLMFVGREHSVETEGSDRVTSHLNPLVEFNIKRIFPKNQNIVLVVQSGGAFMELNWNNKVKSIVQMWLGGEACGGAVANVLFGKVNPSGRLSETFPKHSRTDIDYPGDGYKVCYDEKWRVGYRYYDLHPDEVWYPFGYGLSYTTFSYSNLNITPNSDGFTVSVDVENTGSVAGSEVVQLYVSDRVSTVSKPYKELINFEKVELKPGEKHTIKFSVNNSELSYYNTVLKKWITEPGVYDILVGASAADIRLQDEYIYDAESEYTIKYNAEQIMG